MVLNKATIIIIYALHFPKFPFFAALQMRPQSTYDTWTLTPKLQRIGVSTQTAASLEKVRERMEKGSKM